MVHRSRRTDFQITCKLVNGADSTFLVSGSMTPHVVQFLILALSAALSSTTEISLAWVMGDRTRDSGDPSKKWPIGPIDP